MSEEWQYQIRLTIHPPFSGLARQGVEDERLSGLNKILEEHRARLKCQYDAFADYVAEAEAEGVENYPLHAWTKATIEDPAKKEKYLNSFTVYVAEQEVYSKEETDPLAEALKPLVSGDVIADLKVYDTNPVNNPQPPKGG
ncbi:MAG: hypothetical protein AAF441_21065 [Pseudomonadota bacterium]